MVKKSFNPYFIINPKSGKGKCIALMPAIKDYFGVGEDSFGISTRHGEMEEITQKAIEKGYSPIVAVGGDGSVNQVARALLHSNVAFGLIPMGSGNGLARVLSLPLKPHKAMQIIKENYSIVIDAVKWDNDFFFNVSGTGFDGLIAYEFQKSDKRGLKGYFREIFKNIGSYNGVNIELEVNGDTIKKNVFMVSFGNGQEYGNGLKVCPKADLQDGLMEITIMEKRSILRLLYFLISLRFKFYPKGLTHYKTHKCTFTSHVKNYSHLDGEPFEPIKNSQLNMLPKALKIIVDKKYYA